MGFLDKQMEKQMAKEKDKAGKSAKKKLDKAVEENTLKTVDGQQPEGAPRKAPPARPVTVFDATVLPNNNETRHAFFEKETANVLGRLPQSQGCLSKLLGKKNQPTAQASGTTPPARRGSVLDRLKKQAQPITVAQCDRKDVRVYRIYFKTSDKTGAGTDSHVFMTLVGSNYRTEPVIFNGLVDVQEMRAKQGHSNEKPFQRDQIDSFKIKCRDLGDLTQVYIGEDDSEASIMAGGSSWHVDRVIVEDKDGNKTHFPLDEWIRPDKDHAMLVPGKLVQKGDAPAEDPFKIYLTDAEHEAMKKELEKDVERYGNAMALNALL